MRQIDDWFGLTSVAEGRVVVVLGMPRDGAASGRSGAAGAPAAIRGWARSQEAIDEHGRRVSGVRVVDGGDTSGDPAALGEAARRALSAYPGAFLLGVGGDHSCTPPLVAAVREHHPDLGVLWLDAHADLFDSYEGDRHSHACALARCWDAGVEPSGTALVGLRSYATEELEPIGRAGRVVTAAEWAREGAAAIAERAAATLAGRPVYVSLDVDVLDPAFASGTGYPTPGGPSSRALLDLLEIVWRRLRVVGLDLVEVAPRLDPTEATAATAAHLLLQVLSHVARAGGDARGLQ